ncbi:MAG: hypothetical protein FD145_685 [Candidatus Saganbacteria bacterium]|uniref:HNH endonuclease n=1 Tax=Candidatus Saganbacteria bacterium TaxID=2575572 RepID=A0A833NS79_UNCSA|nr:MAG: hypothetical protein FD145_685 [Candidatus Saganbacteria bacterium]
MPRRKTKNLTGLKRLKGIGKSVHQAWIGFVCLKCKNMNVFPVGLSMLSPQETYEGAQWKCSKCNFVHSKAYDLPFSTWPKEFIKSDSIKAQRFWQAFFRISTEHAESYWKQCNTCERILPFRAFDKHKGWGPLERQMECRSCKGAINAKLNPKRTKQQLFESSVKRRVADLLLKGVNQSIDIKELFRKFGRKCFKTGKVLDIKKRSTWAIDHILPSKWLYPLTTENAALLSREANNNKRDKWPNEYYTNNELIDLARITGADLSLLASKTPIINPNINVDLCVSRYLQVRERSNLKKRINELKQLLGSYKLTGKLSSKNKKLLGYR